MKPSRLFLALGVAFLLCAGAAEVSERAASGSPVEKVVTLLKDLQKGLESDEKSEQKTYDKYACWCEKTTARKAKGITEAKTDLRSLGQTILSLKGKVATAVSEIEKLDKQLRDNQKEQDQATRLRQKENEIYNDATEDGKQSIAALEKGIAALVRASQAAVARGMPASAFLQQQSSEAAEAVAAVRNLVDAIPVSFAPKPEELALLSEFSSGGASGKYTPASASIQGILQEMYKRFATTVQRATVSECSSNTDYEALMAVKTKEQKELEDKRKARVDVKVEAEAQLADKQSLYDDTQAQMEADIAFFDETKSACESKHKAWTTRSALRKNEIEGVAKAMEILTSDETRTLMRSAIKKTPEALNQVADAAGAPLSFVQVGSAMDATAAAQRARAGAYAALKAQATASHSLRLASLAVAVHEAKGAAFDKVLKSITDVIQVLKKEDKADIEKRDQCKVEYTKTKSVIDDVSWKIEKNEAKINRIDGTVEDMTTEKENTIVAHKEAKAQLAQIDKTRAEEHKAFHAGKKEDETAIKVLKSAREALTEYYKKNNIALDLAQKPEMKRSADEAPDAEFNDGSRSKGAASGIVNLMTHIMENLGNEIKEAAEDEKTALLAWEEQTKSLNKLMDDLKAKEQSLTAAIAKRKKDKDDEVLDKGANDKDLKDEVEYKDSITTDCDYILGAFEKRASARAAELNGLLGAKNFLEGYTPPASLLEKGSTGGKAFDDAALRQVRFLGLGQ